MDAGSLKADLFGLGPAGLGPAFAALVDLLVIAALVAAVVLVVRALAGPHR